MNTASVSYRELTSIIMSFIFHKDEMCIPTGAKIDISINHYDNNARYQLRGASLIITEFKFRAPVTTSVLGNHKATP